MSAGVIPVVLNRGGVTDIVRHSVTGYLAQSAQEIGDTTKEVGWQGEKGLCWPGGRRRCRQGEQSCTRGVLALPALLPVAPPTLPATSQGGCGATMLAAAGAARGLKPALPASHHLPFHLSHPSPPCLPQVFGLDAASLAQLRSNAISWVERFSTKSFAKNFRVLANRGQLTKPFRHLIQHTGGAAAAPPVPA